MLKQRSFFFLMLCVVVMLDLSKVTYGQSIGGMVSNAAPKTIPKKLTLADAENILLERNLSIASARYQIDANRAARLIASYKPNPTITIGAEQFPVTSNIVGSFPRFFSTNSDAGAQPTFTFRIDKNVERGGKREARIAQADFQIKASEAQMLDTVRQQLFQLRQAFNTASLARENLILAKTINQQYEQTEKLTAIKVENGDLPALELYRVKSGKLQYQQQVLQAHNAYQQAVSDVLNLLGAKIEDISQNPDSNDQQALDLDLNNSQPSSELAIKNISQKQDVLMMENPLKTAPLEIIGTFSDRPVIKTVAELKQLALDNRPDVIAAKNNLLAADAALRLAKAQRTRDLDIGYEYQRVGSDSAVGVVVQFPVFIYNNQKAGITQAQAQYKTAETQLHQTEYQVITDVEKAYQSYLIAKRSLDLYNSDNLVQVEKLHGVVAYSYREGAISLFELLDAQRTYNQALTAYNQARADYQMSLWQLEQAIGQPLP